MKSIQFAYAGLLVLLSLLWWIADPLLPGGYEYFAVRSVVINYTGVIGIGVMSLGMILALRPVRVEPLLGGLQVVGDHWLGLLSYPLALCTRHQMGSGLGLVGQAGTGAEISAHRPGGGVFW